MKTSAEPWALSTLAGLYHPGELTQGPRGGEALSRSDLILGNSQARGFPRDSREGRSPLCASIWVPATTPGIFRIQPGACGGTISRGLLCSERDQLGVKRDLFLRY